MPKPKYHIVVCTNARPQATEALLRQRWISLPLMPLI